MQTGKPVVRIFNAAGRSLVSFPWEESGRLVAFGWTDEEVCLVTRKTSSVRARFVFRIFHNHHVFS